MQKNLKLIFIPAKKTNWWTNSGKWTHDTLWHPWPKKLSFFSFCESAVHGKISVEAQGLSFAQTLEKTFLFPLCTENRYGTELFPHDIPRQYYNQTLWSDSTGSILKPLMKVRNGLITDS